MKKALLCISSGLMLLLISCSNAIKDRDGNIYGATMIGNKIWMTENLNTSRFRNGDQIPEVKSQEEWIKYGAEGKPACCIIMNDKSNSERFGRLYNWFAVNDPRGLAPKGWHIASDDEWSEMITILGGGIQAALVLRDPGSLERKASEPKGFTGLAAGGRSAEGQFFGMNDYGYWWTSTSFTDPFSVMRYLSYISTDIGFNAYKRSFGLSVRCVRD